jgi:3-deoxy-D-manno-octulosonic acid kinase
VAVDRTVQSTMMTDERVLADQGGGIVFDAALVPAVDRRWFEPAWWQGQGALAAASGGRGGVSIIRTDAGEAVLRHYRRGGMVARLMGDRYLWLGADRTRSFREFRLMAHLLHRGLPVPAPLAAGFVRHGMRYTAELITLRIPCAATLAEKVLAAALDTELAGHVGALVARFHREGVWHADLNAHNILINPEGLYLIDFDRGRLRAPHLSWQQDNLDRLRRSLLKLGAARSGEASFDHDIWKPLVYRYERTLGA